jgi:hypothetical protein|tara:strand:- start:21893 stop:22339 length:447 start_codon:yes stop_codon:yes gene_type:complete
MADSKLSELTAATTAAATDTAYLVQSSVSKQITVANLFGNVSTPVQFTNSIQIGDHNTITAAGAISTDYNVTYINDPSGGGTCSIGAGLDGQIIIIIMSSNSGGHTIQVSGANVAQTISLDAAGESATMLYDTGLSKWFFIGGSATVT